MTVCNCNQKPPDPACPPAEFQSRKCQQRQMPDVHRYWAGAVEQRLHDYWQNVAVDDRQRRMLMSIRYRGALLCWDRRISIPSFLGFNWTEIQNVHRFHQAYRNPLYCTCWQWIFRKLVHLYWPACNWLRRRCSYMRSWEWKRRNGRKSTEPVSAGAEASLTESLNELSWVMIDRTHSHHTTSSHRYKYSPSSPRRFRFNW